MHDQIPYCPHHKSPVHSLFAKPDPVISTLDQATLCLTSGHLHPNAAHTKPGQPTNTHAHTLENVTVKEPT